jgi:hypothetical protein
MAPNQVAHKSWWPKPTYWKNQKANGYNFGHWTEWNETWYQDRLSDIAEGTAQPETPEFWRNNLRGASSWRKATARLNADSDVLFLP